MKIVNQNWELNLCQGIVEVLSPKKPYFGGKDTDTEQQLC